MSKPLVDMPKVTQMLDNGWEVRLIRRALGSYAARARHPYPNVMKRLYEFFPKRDEHGEESPHWDRGWLITDDFKPDEALTRLAYKVHGEILDVEDDVT